MRNLDDPLVDPEDRPSALALWRAFWRPSLGNLLVGVCVFIFALTATLQVRRSQSETTFANTRREDLVQMLDQLTTESRRMDDEIRSLEEQKRELESGANTRQQAEANAQQRARDLGILAGTLRAKGPGIRMQLDDPKSKITAEMMVDCLQELRDAGAEVIELNDTVRVTASTSVVNSPDGVRVDGHSLRPPYIVKAIGDSHALAEGARFRGGIVSQVQAPNVGGTATISVESEVNIDSLAPLLDPKHAKPSK